MINICHGLAVPAVSSSNDVHLIASCVQTPISKGA